MLQAADFGVDFFEYRFGHHSVVNGAREFPQIVQLQTAAGSAPEVIGFEVVIYRSMRFVAFTPVREHHRTAVKPLYFEINNKRDCPHWL